MNTRRMVAGALVATVALIVIVGLAVLVLPEDDAGVEAYPTPTYTRSDSRAQNVADAMTTFMTYIRVSDEVAQNHFRGWEQKIKPLTSGEVQEWHKNYDPQAKAEDYYQVGERVVESVRLKPGRYRVAAEGLGRADLGACIDSSGLQVAAPGGQDDGLPPGKYSVSVTMVLWPDGWRVSQYSVDDPQSSESDASSCVADDGQG